MKVAGEGFSRNGADDSIAGEQARGDGKCHNKNVIFIEREISKVDKSIGPSLAVYR